MIPFTKTTLGQEEKDAIAGVIDSGWVVMGEKTEEFEKEFAEYVGSKYAVFVDSGTAALDLSVKFLKQHIGIASLYVPSFTFTSTAEVVLHNGLDIGWLDINRENYCIETSMETAIKVHFAGNKANSNGMIEDSAHLIERGQCINNDNFVCFSFYATKNLTTINGGMIAVNDEVAYRWLRGARDHGISEGTSERYKNGRWKYSIDFVGWRYKADDVRAVIGLEQLKKLDKNNIDRDSVVAWYNEILGLKNRGNHLYPILVNDRDKFIETMSSVGIQCSVHFLPLHQMPAYKLYKSEVGLPNTEYIGEHIVSLPLYPQLTLDEIRVISQRVLETKLLIK